MYFWPNLIPFRRKEFAKQRKYLTKPMVCNNGSQRGAQASNISVPLKFVRDENSQVPTKSEDPGMGPIYPCFNRPSRLL